jgi:hypothetical protein
VREQSSNAASAAPGDVCDRDQGRVEVDRDDDGVSNEGDNHPDVANADRVNVDAFAFDNCSTVANPNREDTEMEPLDASDLQGDACDCP